MRGIVGDSRAFQIVTWVFETRNLAKNYGCGLDMNDLESWEVEAIQIVDGEIFREEDRRMKATRRR